MEDSIKIQEIYSEVMSYAPDDHKIGALLVIIKELRLLRKEMGERGFQQEEILREIRNLIDRIK